MTSIPQVSMAVQTLLTTTVEQLASEMRYTKRPDKAKFSPSTLVQTLVLGWLANPDATLEQLAHNAARLGVEVSFQAIDQRFTRSTALLLRQVLLASLDHRIASDPVAIPILQRFSGLFIQDSTTIVLPDALADHARGCGGSTSTNTSAALKCGLQLDLCSGMLSQLNLVDGRTSDHQLPLQHAALPAKSLRLADLGFADASVFTALDNQDVYWLSRVEATARIREEGKASLPLRTFVEQLGPVAEWEGWVVIGTKQRVRARLLIRRVPQQVAEQRRRRLWQQARKKGKTPSAAALALADWTILMTNVPEELLTLEEALVLVKVRWQIELMFKLWKSEGQVDQWRSSKPERILCEVYAKLLAMVIQHWLLVVGCWKYPDRSLTKAAQVIRDHAPELASARGRLDRLTETVETIQALLRHTARLNPRKKHPNTYQSLLDLSAHPKQAGCI